MRGPGGRHRLLFSSSASLPTTSLLSFGLIFILFDSFFSNCRVDRVFLFTLRLILLQLSCPTPIPSVERQDVVFKGCTCPCWVSWSYRRRCFGLSRHEKGVARRRCEACWRSCSNLLGCQCSSVGECTHWSRSWNTGHQARSSSLSNVSNPQGYDHYKT